MACISTPSDAVAVMSWQRADLQDEPQIDEPLCPPDAGASVKQSVCRAFASWLRLTVEPFPAEAAQHLVQMVLEGLSHKDTFDSAVSFFFALFNMCFHRVTARVV